MSEGLLTEALLLTMLSQVAGKALTYVHTALEARLSPIDLQTIRDIAVDCPPKPSMALSLIVDRWRMADEEKAGVPASVLDGVEALVCARLGIAGVRQAAAVQTVCEAAALSTGLVEAIHAAIAGNIAVCRAAGIEPRSKANWRWRVPQLVISAHNRSPEVVLERAIVNAAERTGRQDWSNQVPVASGLAAGAGERRRAIDLVQQRGERHFELIELKIASDTPLSAAIQIIGYACIWLLARQEGPPEGQSDLLAADVLETRVLAPRAFYSDFRLGTLAAMLDDELHALGEAAGVAMSFGFDVLPEQLRAPRGLDDAELLALLDARAPL